MAGQGKIPASQIKEKFVHFLESFNAHDDHEAISQDADRALPTYVRMARDMDTSQGTTLYINFEHVNEYDPQLADAIITHHLEYDEALRQAVQTMVAKYAPEKLENGDRKPHEFFCSFYNLAGVEPMRKLKTHYIGRLVSFAGTVTRTSEVRPELFSATFKCMACGTLKRNVPQQFRYTEPLVCDAPTCGNTSAWQLAKDECTFVDWQKACVQEAPSEVPSGCLPRTLDVILRNDMVEKVRPGDKVVFTGDVIVVPDVSVFNAPGEKVVAKKGQSKSSRAPGTVAGTADGGITGVRGVGVRELNYRLAFLSSSVQVVDKGQGMVNIRGDETTNDVLAQFTEEQTDDLAKMANDPQIYSNLARSIAPGVFGHEDVKRAILLMLFGGVHKTTRDGTKLRGDINVAIVGDPSCGKSQLLKYISTFLPRAVYTSGKSSSAAGLTATVARDNDTNEYCIEAGALMLADNGICCIDEFDKMDAKDQVAIHEAMEQQTISITKAGIQATLNARTSILAAANPIGGRYDKSKPLRANVTLTPAILSRFDLLHVMVDEPNDIHDFAIATHIVNVHRDGSAALNVPYDMGQMQRYIKFARTYKPEITSEAARMLVESYKHLRADDAVPGSNTSYRITVRQLEALIRLSQALARVRCSDRVNTAHVKEATRLLKNSIMAIEAPDVALEDDDEFGQEELEAAAVAVRGAIDSAAAAAAAGGSGSVGAEGSLPATLPVEGAAAAEVQGGADVTGSNPTPAMGEENQPPNVPPPPLTKKPVMQVTQKKYNMIKNLLTMKLQEVEDAQAAAQQEGEAVVLEGMKQHDLTKWFFEHQQQREVYATEEEMLNEIVLVEKVIQRLIKKDHVLTVVEEPQREQGESADAYLRRATAERVIALHPNFVQE